MRSTGAHSRRQLQIQLLYALTTVTSTTINIVLRMCWQQLQIQLLYALTTVTNTTSESYSYLFAVCLLQQAGFASLDSSYSLYVAEKFTYRATELVCRANVSWLCCKPCQAVVWWSRIVRDHEYEGRRWSRWPLQKFRVPRWLKTW